MPASHITSSNLAIPSSSSHIELDYPWAVGGLEGGEDTQPTSRQLQRAHQKLKQSFKRGSRVGLKKVLKPKLEKEAKVATTTALEKKSVRRYDVQYSVMSGFTEVEVALVLV